MSGHAKSPPPPSAGHLDNPPGGLEEAALLKARVRTLELDGEAAMSQHDLRNGYSPEGIIRLLNRQITQIQRSMNETNEAKESAPGRPEEKTKATPGGGALERLGKASEIRRAIFLVRAQLKEIRKNAKDKITLLERAQAGLLDDLEPRQMQLFDLAAEVSPEVQEILDHPGL